MFDSVVRYVKIKTGDEELGRLYLLGSEIGERAYTFLVKSSGTVENFASQCERVFDSVVRMVDDYGRTGNTFIGKKVIDTDPSKLPLSIKISFMKHLAENLSKEVG